MTNRKSQDKIVRPNPEGYRMGEMGLNKEDAEDRVQGRRCVLLRPSPNWGTNGLDSRSENLIYN